MSFRWQLTVYLIALWIGVSVDGRFRRLSSGLSSFSSGGWRLMKPNEYATDYSASNGHHGGLSPSLSSLLSSQQPLSSILSSSGSSYLNDQRYPTINPVKSIHTNQHFQLPIQSPYRLGLYNNHHHRDPTDLTEYDLESTISTNQPDNLDQQSRSTGDNNHEKITESQITITPSSIASSNVPRPHLDKVKIRPNLGSPESLLGEEVSSRSAPSVSSSISPSSSNHQIHYANKKAESESAHEGNPLIQYRSFNHGKKHSGSSSFSDLYFVAIVVGSSGIAIFAVIGAGYCFYRFQQHAKSIADTDYPAYGVVGPITKETANNSGNISPIGDRKLAQSAQMYHYHHQKQQMIASEKGATSRHTSASDVDSEEENEEGDYTVYECPGLASTGEMEVKNPLFQDDITPVSSPSIVTNGEGGGGEKTKDKK